MRKFTATELAEIIEKHGKWLRGEDGGERANLSSADLSYANLRSADLRYANLSYANLSSANLRSADLRYANLSYANLSSANLSYANLRSADLSYANLRSADLRYANLSYANLRSADLRYANLSYAKNQLYVGQRSDGYKFFAKHDKEKDCWMLQAGCRYFTPDQYREHTETYSDDVKKAETLALIDFAETLIRIRGIVE